MSLPHTGALFLKHDQKADGHQEKSIGVLACDLWDYHLHGNLKARLTKRRFTAHEKPASEAEDFDYDSDDTIPYGPDMPEHIRALVMKPMPAAAEHTSLDSDSDDSNSGLSCEQWGNDSMDTNTNDVHVEVDLCDSNSSFDQADIDDEMVMAVLNQRLTDEFYEFVSVLNDDISNIDDYIDLHLQTTS